MDILLNSSSSNKDVDRVTPLSQYIFILAIEPLARMIALDSEIKGITLKEREFKLGQYADDMCLMIEPTEVAMKKSFKIFHEFYLTSGLKLNYDKTNIVCLGNQRSPQV